jgi:hypothetical protein
MKRTIWTLAWILVSAGVGLAQQTFYFPQVADGRDPGGGNAHWHTTIFLSNQGSTAVASGTITFFLSNGGPMNISAVNELDQPAATGNQISFQISPGQSRKYTTTAPAGLQVGYAVVTANAPVAGNAVFSHWTNPPNEVLIAEGTVPSASLLIKQAVFGDTQFGFNTGVAVANPGASTVVVTFEYVNSLGQTAGTAFETLAPGQHIARFATELFGNIPATAGRIQVTASTSALAVVGLRFDNRLERFTTFIPFTVP